MRLNKKIEISVLLLICFFLLFAVVSGGLAYQNMKMQAEIAELRADLDEALRIKAALESENNNLKAYITELKNGAQGGSEQQPPVSS